MSATNGVLVLLWIGLTAYATLGGADFGAGCWDLFAGGSDRGREVRTFITESIGPVWEVNHVWLIFSLVVLWTAFAPAFAAIASALYIPLTAAAVGIILRGSGFAFRGTGSASAFGRISEIAFAMSSVITPFFMGTVAGAIASGRVATNRSGNFVFTSWTGPLPLAVGFLAIGVCALTGAVFLAAHAEHRGLKRLTGYFARRAIGASAATGALALTALVIARDDAPLIFDRLTSRALPSALVTSIFGGLTIALLISRHFAAARLSVVTTVVLLIGSWFRAQYPWMIVDRLSVSDAASSPVVMRALLTIFLVGLLVLLPSLGLLYHLYQTDRLEPSVRPDFEPSVRAAGEAAVRPTRETADPSSKSDS